MKTIGILGAGQLGCMLSESLFRFGAKVHFYDPSPHAPGRYRSPYFHQSSWLDKESMLNFFRACDVVTYEFENVHSEHLKDVSRVTGTPLFPSADVLETTQERQKEKQFLFTHKLPQTPFLAINTPAELDKIRGKIKSPLIAKTLQGGYDGKGQRRIDCDKDLDEILPMLPLVLEDTLNIYCEASVITARNIHGAITQFPIFENTHRDHILDVSVVPSYSLTDQVKQALFDISKQAIHLVGGGVVGLLTTEFFICKEEPPSSFLKGRLQKVGPYYIGVNEFAPRTHNSGHVSRKACTFSQFDILAHILLDLPLPAKIDLINPSLYYGMGNLLGETWLKQAHIKNPSATTYTTVNEADKTLNLEHLQQYPNILEIYLYGKQVAKQKRKMGHFISVGATPKEVYDNISSYRNDLEKCASKINP